jgi:hypothetical protein
LTSENKARKNIDHLPCPLFIIPFLENELKMEGFERIFLDPAARDRSSRPTSAGELFANGGRSFGEIIKEGAGQNFLILGYFLRIIQL